MCGWTDGWRHGFLLPQLRVSAAASESELTAFHVPQPLGGRLQRPALFYPASALSRDALPGSQVRRRKKRQPITQSTTTTTSTRPSGGNRMELSGLRGTAAAQTIVHHRCEDQPRSHEPSYPCTHTSVAQAHPPRSTYRTTNPPVRTHALTHARTHARTDARTHARTHRCTQPLGSAGCGS